MRNICTEEATTEMRALLDNEWEEYTKEEAKLAMELLIELYRRYALEREFGSYLEGTRTQMSGVVDFAVYEELEYPPEKGTVFDVTLQLDMKLSEFSPYYFEDVVLLAEKSGLPPREGEEKPSEKELLECMELVDIDFGRMLQIALFVVNDPDLMLVYKVNLAGMKKKMIDYIKGKVQDTKRKLGLI